MISEGVGGSDARHCYLFLFYCYGGVRQGGYGVHGGNTTNCDLWEPEAKIIQTSRVSESEITQSSPLGMLALGTPPRTPFHSLQSLPTHSPSRNQRQNVPEKNVNFDTFDVHVMVNSIEPNFQNIIFTLSTVSLITQK